MGQLLRQTVDVKGAVRARRNFSLHSYAKHAALR